MTLVVHKDPSLSNLPNMADKLQGPQALVTPEECLRNYLNTSGATGNLENIAVSSIIA